MAESTHIEWTDATWNPVTGCTLVSDGCKNCYAATLAATRLKHHPSRQGLARLNAAGEAKFTGEVRFNEEWLDQPLRWKRSRRIFVCAHGDLFHESVPDGWIMRVFNVMATAQHHSFQVLTKRPERMRDFFNRWADLAGEDLSDFRNARGPDETRAAHPSGRGQLFASMLDAMGDPPPGAAYPTFDWAGGMMRWPDILPNVWLGTSVEDQATADARIPHLLATPAAVRFISAEPLLGPVDILPYLFISTFDDEATLESECNCGQTADTALPFNDPATTDPADIAVPRLDWVIVGGESGKGARPMHPDWAQALRNQCQDAGVPFFFKQWGEWIFPGQSSGQPPVDRQVKWLREDGLLADQPISALIKGALGEGQIKTVGGEEVTIYPDHKWTMTARVGKSRSGRHLDGHEWNEMPGKNDS